MANISAALGSVIGYLGGEVSESSTFDRLLWPHRYYNYLTTRTLLIFAFLMPMGGPVHRAALETLDKFRLGHIYRAQPSGRLGSAFFPRKNGVSYFHRTADREEDKTAQKEVRNGFWIEVLTNVRHVDGQVKNRAINKPANDIEDRGGPGGAPQRTFKGIFKLRLEFFHRAEAAAIESSDKKIIRVCETSITLQTLVGVAASEVTSITMSIVYAVWMANYWMLAYFLTPLLLKFISLVGSVRREGLAICISTDKGDKGATIPSQRLGAFTLRSPEAVIEVEHPNNGFMLITTKYPANENLFQFFRHYGQPLRLSQADRIREVVCITIIYVLVLYFPAGLIALTWMNREEQYLWLGYQTYAIVAMHILRLAGWQGTGRTEEKVAKALERGKIVRLKGEAGFVQASLEAESVGSIAKGKARVKEILQLNQTLLGAYKQKQEPPRIADNKEPLEITIAEDQSHGICEGDQILRASH